MLPRPITVYIAACVSCLVLASVSCTAAQLASVLPVAKTVADLAKDVCKDGDDALACLRRCEDEAERQAAAAD